jgi:hypothetical protein
MSNAVTRNVAGDQRPSVAELVRLAAGRRLTSEHLDDAVRDAADESAAQMNSEGLDVQIEYLVRRLGPLGARDAIERAAYRSWEPAP